MAAIFFRGHPYIWRTTVRHDRICSGSTVNPHSPIVLSHKPELRVMTISFFILGIDMRVLGTHLVQCTGKLACDRKFSEAIEVSYKGAEHIQDLMDQ